MKKTVRLLVCCLTAVMLIIMCQVICFADADLDINKLGSITVEMRDPYTDKPVSGGTLTIYKVADIALVDGELTYIFTDEFLSSGLDISDPEAPKLPFQLSEYVDINHCIGSTTAIGSDGNAVWGNMYTGLYLVRQFGPANGYYPIDSFLVTLPLCIGGEYIYDVNATPKMELLKTPPPPTTDYPDPEKPTEHGDGERDDSEDDMWEENEYVGETASNQEPSKPSDAIMIALGVSLVTLAVIASVVLAVKKRRDGCEKTGE